MGDTPLRKDAARNHRRLLDAGREVFAQRGLGATLNDVARHAGVGGGHGVSPVREQGRVDRSDPGAAGRGIGGGSHRGACPA
ncbi:TetR family transcriptional regulator [Streptomyces sp. NPDC057074]|uniref:TetR family transcriptional regulator n=1 Tax=Streptomyces sp. NPDC057074 TaxID=3346015 RepID=UPI00362B5928